MKGDTNIHFEQKTFFEKNFFFENHTYLFLKNIIFLNLVLLHLNNHIRVRSNVSKVFENILNQQISAHSENTFYKQQTSFRRGFKTQHCILVMIKIFRKLLDKGGGYAALLTDLSKAFDCIPHDLTIAKLHACDFDMPLLKVINGYWTNRHQGVKINDSYSLWKLIKHDVSQGSILGPVFIQYIFMWFVFYNWWYWRCKLRWWQYAIHTRKISR